MRTVQVSEITRNIKEMCIEANHFLSEDMKKALEQAKEKEEAPLGRQILGRTLNETRRRGSGAMFYVSHMRVTAASTTTWSPGSSMIPVVLWGTSALITRPSSLITRTSRNILWSSRLGAGVLILAGRYVKNLHPCLLGPLRNKST